MRRNAFVLAISAMLGALALACGGGTHSSPPTPASTEALALLSAGTPEEASDLPWAGAATTDWSIAGRWDCPSGWFVYLTHWYSICSPPDHPARSVYLDSVVFAVGGLVLAPWDGDDSLVTPCPGGRGDGTATPEEWDYGRVNLGHVVAMTCSVTLGHDDEGIPPSVLTQVPPSLKQFARPTEYAGILTLSNTRFAFRSASENSQDLAIAKQILATLADASQPIPQQTPTPTPIIAYFERLCGAADLELKEGKSTPAHSSETGVYIKIRNKSSTPCQISRPPDIEFLDEHGDVVPIALREYPAALYRVPLVLLPGVEFTDQGLSRGLVGLTLQWSVRDGAGFACTPLPPHIAQLRLVLQSGAAKVSVPVDMAPCDSTVEYQSYQPGTD